MATRCVGNSSDLTSDALPGDGAHLTSDTAASDGSHFTGDTVVAFAFYNVGIQNNEILGAAWNKPNIPKQEKLNDVEAFLEEEEEEEEEQEEEEGGGDERRKENYATMERFLAKYPGPPN